MKTIKYAVVAGLLACVGCLNVSIADSDVCDSKSVSFTSSQDLNTALSNNLPPAVLAVAPQGLTAVCSNPSQFTSLGLPNSYTPPSQSATVNFDFSKDLSDITDVANNLQVNINQLFLDNFAEEGGTGELDFVSSVVVDLQCMNANYSDVATYMAPDAGVGTTLDFKVNLTSTEILTCLQSGPVSLTLTLTSNAITLAQACDLLNQGNLSTNAHMCVAVAGSFSRKL